MATYYSCPNCGRTLAKSLLGGSYFPIYECRKCHALYCQDCGSSNGSRCPDCGASERFRKGEVVAR